MATLLKHSPDSTVLTVPVPIPVHTHIAQKIPPSSISATFCISVISTLGHQDPCIPFSPLGMAGDLCCMPGTPKGYIIDLVLGKFAKKYQYLGIWQIPFLSEVAQMCFVIQAYQLCSLCPL